MVKISVLYALLCNFFFPENYCPFTLGLFYLSLSTDNIAYFRESHI